MKRLLQLVSLLLSVCSISITTRAEETPLDLEEAIRLALAKNYALRVESFDVPIAKAGVTAAWGKFDPRLRLSYQYDENGSPQPTDPFSGARPPSSIETNDTYKASIDGLMPWGLEYSLGAQTVNNRGTFNNFTHRYYSFSGIEVTQPILRGFGFGPALTTVRIAKLDRSISEWDHRRALTDTITRVIYAYHNLYLTIQNLRAAERSRDLAASLLSENERRFKVGNVAESDVTAAKARAAFREDAVLRAQRSVDEQTIALRMLISDERDLEKLRAPITIKAPDQAENVAVHPAEDFQQALARRPEYQRMRLLAKRSRLNRDFQSNQRLPQVNLVGSYGYYGIGSSWPESRRSLQDRDTHSYSAGAVVNVPLTFTQERGRYRSAELQLKQSELQVEQWEQQVMADLANAAAAVANSQKRVAAARQARIVAQQSLDNEVKLHRAGNGRGSTFQVLQAQEYLSGAEFTEYQTNADAHLALAEYDRQLGRTLERHHIELEAQKVQSVPRS